MSYGSNEFASGKPRPFLAGLGLASIVANVQPGVAATQHENHRNHRTGPARAACQWEIPAGLKFRSPDN
eukprot:11732324-Alexandrium_andersonii.AAC.1